MVQAIEMPAEAIRVEVEIATTMTGSHPKTAKAQFVTSPAHQKNESAFGKGCDSVYSVSTGLLSPHTSIGTCTRYPGHCFVPRFSQSSETKPSFLVRINNCIILFSFSLVSHN